MVRLFKRRRPWTFVENGNIDTNFSQAAQALELAGEQAAKSGNSDQLVNVAHGYLRMVETYSSLPPHMFVLDSTPPAHEPGFRGSPKELNEEDGE